MKYNINWDLLALGIETDLKIAKDLGISHSTVSWQRSKRNIPAVPKKKEFDTSQLGILPDYVVAKMNNVGIMAVRSERVRQKLPPTDRKCLTEENEAATYPEAIIDIYFHQHSIIHVFQYNINKYRPDWYLPETNTIVEYAGFTHGRFEERYNDNLNTKIELYKSLGYDVLIIYPEDLNKYDLGIIPKLTKKCICIECGKEWRLLIKNLCASCYRKQYPIIYPESGVTHCVSCNQEFGSKGLKGIVKHSAHNICKMCCSATSENREIDFERIRCSKLTHCIDCNREFGSIGKLGGILKHDTKGRCKNCAQQFRKKFPNC